VRGGERDGEPGLAGTSRAGERQRSVTFEEVAQAGELGVTAERARADVLDRLSKLAAS